MDSERLVRAFDKWRMESVSHTLLKPQIPWVYIPEQTVRRGLAAQDIILPNLQNDFYDYAAGPEWDTPPSTFWGPSYWWEISHIGLSSSGDIRMAQVTSGNIVFPEESAPRWFEIYVIKTGHPNYRIALSRVLMLLPGLEPGGGMVRLAPPIEAPWPFFDYDFTVAPLYQSLAKINRELAPPIFETLVSAVPTTGPVNIWPDVPPLQPAGGRIMQVSWDINGDILLWGGATRIMNQDPDPAKRFSMIVFRLPTSHPQYARVFHELRRVKPGLRKGAGFTDVDFGSPPWPFIPFEEAVDRGVDQATKSGSNYIYPFSPPPPPLP